ncbi:hypothetical protein XTALMG727_1258 [Xanthomonas translucens pv. arrhenatheri LMG 727]|uniref:Uncharacterized protein n=1 Tax=Xanthomonas graminis pv. arrhenatheri LMG 727 TaxID=1195923 RepID=A0A0K2ZPB5_9XANT|nr:hypothetical protein XTALMG727_1258 [Xanthomonas translucens pv. arrhenatheri LMG 727]
MSHTASGSAAYSRPQTHAETAVWIRDDSAGKPSMGKALPTLVVDDAWLAPAGLASEAQHGTPAPLGMEALSGARPSHPHACRPSGSPGHPTQARPLHFQKQSLPSHPDRIRAGERYRWRSRRAARTAPSTILSDDRDKDCALCEDPTCVQAHPSPKSWRCRHAAALATAGTTAACHSAQRMPAYTPNAALISAAAAHTACIAACASISCGRRSMKGTVSV